jgi:hypothetical protein
MVIGARLGMLSTRLWLTYGSRWYRPSRYGGTSNPISRMLVNFSADDVV